MQKAPHRKIVIFGAGKIGRSFIGQLFSRGGFEVVFVDIFKQVIDELNERRSYNIIIKSASDEIIRVDHVRGVLADDILTVAGEVASADIVAVSVGLHGLKGIFPALAKGLIERYHLNAGLSLDIIIAENMRDADAYFRAELTRFLPPGYPFQRLIGLVETSIGKMVPIMLKKDVEEDILQVFAEPYNTLILDKKAFKNPIPQVKGLAPKENMKAWVDRKLFIHNLGHATAAYMGYLHNPRLVFLYEALAIKSVHDAVRNTMLQSAAILLKKYPDEFTPADLTEHIDDLLFRFRNKALGDTLFRVGCDLMRKLGPEDRLAGAIKSAISLGLPYDKLLHALVCGFHFRAADENGDMLTGDIEFSKQYERGVDHVLTTVCGFNRNQYNRLFEEARIIDSSLYSGNTE